MFGEGHKYMNFVFDLLGSNLPPFYPPRFVFLPRDAFNPASSRYRHRGFCHTHSCESGAAS